MFTALEMDALTNCLGLGGGEEIYSPSSYFFLKFFSGCTKFEDRAPHSYGWTVCIILSLGEVEIGPGIHI